MSEISLSPKATKSLAPILARFAPLGGRSVGRAASFSVGLERLPVPWLAHLALMQVVGAKDLGIAEKTRWRVAFQFDGVGAVLAHQKFGVRLYVSEADLDGRSADELSADMVSKINAIVRVLERDSLKALAAQRVSEGYVTVLNQQAWLRRSYEYFRDDAQRLLAASEASDTEIGSSTADTSVPLRALEAGSQQVLSLLGHLRLRRPAEHLQFKARKRVRRALTGLSIREESKTPLTEMMEPYLRGLDRREKGSFTAVAAINAYFSWLEHVLVLMLAFSGEKPSNGVLRKHITDKWGEKYKRVFDIPGDRDAARVLSKLFEVAETYRNTYAHGGFDKQGATLGVHIDGIGAVPARLTDVRRSPHFDLQPFDPISFDEVCDTFGEVDHFLENGPLRMAMRFIRGGLDVAFDPRSRQRYRRAMATETRFANLLERESRAADDYLNMDF